jgi:hypothetical protein
MSVSLCDENLINIAILVSLTRRNEDYEMIGIDCYILRLDAAWSARWHETTQKNPERRSLRLESGVAYLATILSKVSIEMDSFLHDVVRGDRLPTSIILRIKGASAGFDARGTRS